MLYSINTTKDLGDWRYNPARSSRKAHLGRYTISTSKMDSEPNYHKPSDQFETLDIDNMTEIIKAIAKSAQSIIAGKDTPNIVDAAQLK